MKYSLGPLQGITPTGWVLDEATTWPDSAYPDDPPGDYEVRHSPIPPLNFAESIDAQVLADMIAQAKPEDTRVVLESYNEPMTWPLFTSLKPRKERRLAARKLRQLNKGRKP